MDESQYTRWRVNLVPLLYDWLANHHLQWPSQACRCAGGRGNRSDGCEPSPGP
jgi:hypothetical protein